MLLDLKYLVAEKLQTDLLLPSFQLRMAFLFNGSFHGMYLTDEDPQITFLWWQETKRPRQEEKKVSLNSLPGLKWKDLQAACI